MDSGAADQAALVATAASAVQEATFHADTAAMQQHSVQEESVRSKSPALGEQLAITSLPVTTGTMKASALSASHCCAPM